MKSFRIGDREVGPDHEPFIIAEMSGNHNGSMERGLEIIRAAAKAGTHSIKLQTYTADTITMDCDAPGFTIEDKKSLWTGRRLHELYHEAHTPWAWHKAFFEEAKKLGIICFSSPFDISAVDFLEELGAPVYKIASFEIVHLPLIRKAASTGKPLIMSTGLASEEEIKDAVEAAKGAGAKDIMLLKCTSAYPAEAKDANLSTIPYLQEKYGVHVGLSDHTMGVGVPVAAVAYGAVAIEKHFTLSRDDGGVDSKFSMDPPELSLLVSESKKAWQARGKVVSGPSEAEKGSLIFRPSIHIQQDAKKGEVVTTFNTRICRPGFGMAPKYYEGILGKKFAKDVKQGDKTTADLFE